MHLWRSRASEIPRCIIYRLAQSVMTSFIAESARLASLFAILDVIQGENEKTLIFLESLEMQKCLAALIQRGATPFRTCQ